MTANTLKWWQRWKTPKEDLQKDPPQKVVLFTEEFAKRACLLSAEKVRKDVGCKLHYIQFMTGKLGVTPNEMILDAMRTGEAELRWPDINTVWLSDKEMREEATRVFESVGFQVFFGRSVSDGPGGDTLYFNLVLPLGKN